MKAARGIILTLLFCLAGLARAGSPFLSRADFLPDSAAVVTARDSAVTLRTDTATEKTGRLTEKTVAATDSAVAASAATAPADTLRLFSAADSVGGTLPPPMPKAAFIPKPKRALWLALVFPGAGQIYNRKFWKLPIIYGGFLGCTYALMWNQQMYMDYSQAYLDIMDDDPNTDSYMDMLPPRYDITGREEQFKNIFKNKKDYYRRYRDLSAFCFAAVYLLSVIDAYVDAQLSAFDISRDLSMRFEPAVISERGWHRSTSYGIGCSLNF